MKNKFEHRGDHVAIILSSGEALIDLDDLNCVSSVDGTWYACAKSATTYCMINVRRPDGKRVPTSLHLILMGACPGKHIDHINHDGLDNRRGNLRRVTVARNALNRRGPNSNSTSGIRGVHRGRPGKWRTTISVDGRVIRLGTYADQQLAARVAQEYLGLVT